MHKLPRKDTLIITNEDINKAYGELLSAVPAADGESPMLSICCPIWQAVDRHYGDNIKEVNVNSHYIHATYNEHSRCSTALAEVYGDVQQTLFPSMELVLQHNEKTQAFMRVFDYTIDYHRALCLNEHMHMKPPSYAKISDLDNSLDLDMHDDKDWGDYWKFAQELLKNSINKDTQRMEGRFTFQVSVNEMRDAETEPSLHGSLGSFHQVVG